MHAHSARLNVPVEEREANKRLEEFRDTLICNGWQQLRMKLFGALLK